jgi:hypothetical protein
VELGDRGRGSFQSQFASSRIALAAATPATVAFSPVAGVRRL